MEKSIGALCPSKTEVKQFFGQKPGFKKVRKGGFKPRTARFKWIIRLRVLLTFMINSISETICFSTD